jgi:DNA-binding NarL/FixJ family response regulator
MFDIQPHILYTSGEFSRKNRTQAPLLKKIPILVIEDNRLLRDGISAMLDEQTDIRVVGALGNSDRTLAVIRGARPVIVLLDLGLRAQNSLQLVKSIRKTFAGMKVVVMDLVPLQSDVVAYVQAGVSGFILKDATVDDFLHTIRSVAGGETILPPQLTGSLFSQIVDHAVRGSARSVLMESVRMTKRERQVVGLIADGMTNKEIAQELHLSTSTVKSHIHNILEKLALRSRVQIARYAHTSGEYPPGEPEGM